MHDFIGAISSNYIAIFLVAIASIVAIWATNFARALAKNRSGITRPLYRPYTLYTAFISAWILSNAYFQSGLLVYLGEPGATLMALAANLFSGLAFAFAYLFSCRLVSEHQGFKIKRWHWWFFLTTCAITLVTNLVPGLNVVSVDVYDIGNFVIRFGPTSGVFFGILILLIIMTLTNFVYSSRSKVKLQQIKAKYMVLGMVAFIVSTFMAHFLIPVVFNDFSIVWVPPALSIIEALLVGYALLHNRFYSSRYIAMIVVSFLINASLYIVPISLLTARHFPMESVIFVAWTVLAGMFWNRSHKYIRGKVNRLFYKEKGNPVENICNLIGEFRYSTDDAVVQLNKVLNAKFGRIQKVDNNADNNVFLSCFHGDRSVLVKEELEYEIKHEEPEVQEELLDVTRAMVNAGTSLVLPITNEKKEVTHLYMVSKDNDLFSSEEIMGLQRLFDEANRFIVTEDKVRKSQVLAGSIAHEIRNPLTKIKYHFERIDADMFGVENGSLAPFASQDMQKLYQELSEGKKAVQLGTRFIDAILDELRGDGISTSLFAYYSAAELTTQAIKDFSFYSEDHRSRIDLNVQDDFFFHGSDTLYSFVLLNLLKNAVYYFDSHPESRIRIHFAHSKEGNSVHVVDTGPGIPVAQLSQIFDEFYTSGKQQGNGLGLSYCKRVMESFGGTIRCDSVEGEYTEFVLTFPSVDQQEQDEETQSRIKQFAAGKSCLVVAQPEAGRWLSKQFGALDIQACFTHDVETGFTHELNQPVDFIVLERAMLEQDMALVKALRAGDLGHHAQVTPVLVFDTNAQTTPSAFSEHLVQGELEGVFNKLLFLRSFNNLIDEGKLAKLGSLIGKRVLVVDDMQVNRMLVKAYLTSEGIEVEEATSGDESIQKVKTEHFDLILMDIHMPGRNGIEATHEIRRLIGPIPVVALSGEYSEEVTLAIREVMQDHLVKPITKQQLLRTLTKWLVRGFASHETISNVPDTKH
ncbi:Sensory box histidine kinase/response regulator [Grimontia indica]|uniref:histidine kinase n=1 Tax=Grimontia indica TaxID=1056512 RepID=R1IJ73_9GAMM|nr:hybrid sensor histidine kinase/response regulator [Grimontia indica]EOD77492.1 Sensory box histidine kinase/response regulator [Grimontia indica]